jgi:hypothetical protein
VVNIVELFPEFPAYFNMPHIASKDMSTIESQELAHTFINPDPAPRFSTIDNTQLQVLHQMASWWSSLRKI